MTVRSLLLFSALLMTGCRSSIAGDFPPRLVVPESIPTEVDAVVFLLGDAGRTDKGRSPVLAELAKEVEWWSEGLGRDSAVSVAFLGDVVYPDGVHERGHPDFPQDSIRLWNQIDVVGGPNAMAHATLGLFLAGNHDWGNMTGDPAVARALNLRRELDSARVKTGVRVSLSPAVDDPGPVVRDLRQNVRLLFVDTHWWLQERSERAKVAFFERVEVAIEESGDREVIVLAHHPWASAGPHGVVASGSRAIGLLYLLSKSGTYVQDVNAPAHKDFRERLQAAFERAGKVPLVFAAGHDHSLQVIAGTNEGDPAHILVSGSGSKLSSIEDTTALRHAAVQPGYMRLVFRTDGAVDLHVRATHADYLSCPEDVEERVTCMSAAADSFMTIFSDRILTASESDSIPRRRDPALSRSAIKQSGASVPEEPDPLDDVTPPPPAVHPDRVGLYRDSVVATPGQSYAAGRIHRWFLGDLNRDLWDIPFKVGVLNLDAVGGSLEPDELSGGKQTLGLKFDGADGRTYQFRSVVKDASRAIPRALRSGPVDEVLQDQMAAQFPLSAMVVAELLEAAGVLVAKPRPVVMPDDDRLGEYRDLFAGRMGWIEERPNELDGDRPGFAGSTKISGTDVLYETLIEDPRAYVNGPELLKARLIDFFVGDWDRHYGNWRWASFDEGAGRVRWDPIPRDRDWALARIDGLVPTIARTYYPKYVGFGPEYPSLMQLIWASQNFDRRLLNQMEKADFRRVTAELEMAFTDDVIDRAVGVLPTPYLDRVGDRLRSELKSRRDLLGQASSEFYALLSQWVDVRGTNRSDRVTIRAGQEGTIEVRITSGPDSLVTYERTFTSEETDEVRIYLLGGDDVVELHPGPHLPINFKIVAGPGDDRVVTGQGERSIEEPGFAMGAVEFFGEDPTPVDTAGLEEDEAEEAELAGERPTVVWDRRDWGSQWIPFPSVNYASEYGLHVGATVIRRGFGFGADPYANQFSLSILGAASPRRLVVDAGFEHRLGREGWFMGLEAQARTQRLSRFFGLGNETTNSLPEESYETRRSLRNVELLVGHRPEAGHWRIWAGPRIRRWGRTDVLSPTVFQLFPVAGADPTTLIGVIAGGSRDTRDSTTDPRDGSWLRAEIAAYPALADVASPWMGIRFDARRYLGSDRLPGAPALHLGIFSESVGSSAPYFERASLGGRTSLPGFRTGRFRGDHALSGLALARTKMVGTQTALGGIDLGVHAVGTVGRVWLDVEDSRSLHAGMGGGIWISSHALGQTFSITVMNGERGPHTYLDLGFPF